MAIEQPFLPRKDAERVRKKIAATGEKALELLAKELEVIKQHRDQVPESWVDKFRKISDQLRRDYRLDGTASAAPHPPPPVASEGDDPLAGLKILDDEAA